MWCSRNGAQNACTAVIPPHGHQLVCTVCKWTWRNHENIYDCEQPTTACVLHTLKNTHNHTKTSAMCWPHTTLQFTMNVRQNAREICHTLCATIQDLCVYANTEIVRTSDLQNTGQPSTSSCTSDLQSTGSPSAKLWNQDNSPVRCRHQTPTTRVLSKNCQQFFFSKPTDFDLRYKTMFVYKVRLCLFPVQEMT